MGYCVYILYSGISNLYYVGYSDDVHRRLYEHNNSLRKTFTAKHRPWILCKHFDFESRSFAIKVEKAIKNKKSKFVIQQILHNIHSSQALLKFLNISEG